MLSSLFLILGDKNRRFVLLLACLGFNLGWEGTCLPHCFVKIIQINAPVMIDISKTQHGLNVKNSRKIQIKTQVSDNVS